MGKARVFTIRNYINQSHHLAVFRLHGSRFLKPKKLVGTVSGDNVGSPSPPPAPAIIFPGTPYATVCSGEVGYSMPAGTGAAS